MLFMLIKYQYNYTRIYMNYNDKQMFEISLIFYVNQQLIPLEYFVYTNNNWLLFMWLIYIILLNNNNIRVTKICSPAQVVKISYVLK